MKNNTIEEVLDELRFTDIQKDGFWMFIRYAKTCQETGNNKQLKSRLSEIVKEIIHKQ